MKKVFLGFMGVLFAMAGANADTIKAATVAVVNNEVAVVQTGTGGVTPETTRLSNEEGTAVAASTINNTSIGSLAAGTPANPESTINGNDANIQVLQRDKLSVASNPSGAGHCDSGDKCGYVTTGGHNNNTTDKIWMKIQL